MLILTRKIDQSIIIAGNITVMVLGVERDRVKLGITAPADVVILRDELTAPELETLLDDVLAVDDDAGQTPVELLVVFGAVSIALLATFFLAVRW